ncbi:NlpC/P60 family protein [Sphingobium sp. CFD-2]|uniref:NlpC/P60 family protein n=1 Tax=Sphingobium sp. CFD-2 TaxID=2878542 RepID=UPI00214C77B0|nr:NlpC/P60 family protein [Sphingobium sp. CFD-2]
MSDAIVAEARQWIGTPFRWQQSAKGRGCDCKGLVAGVARACGRPEGNSIYALMSAEYRRGVDSHLLLRGLSDLFDRVDAMGPGDVLLMRVGDKAQHLGIYAGGSRMIHTYAKGPRRVIEVPLNPDWPVVGIFRWRDIA